MIPSNYMSRQERNAQRWQFCCSCAFGTLATLFVFFAFWQMAADAERLRQPLPKETIDKLISGELEPNPCPTPYQPYFEKEVADE